MRSLCHAKNPDCFPVPLERRFATLADVQQWLWVPREVEVTKGEGVFGHLKPKNSQEVADMKAAILEGSNVTDLEMSCFTGEYITGTVSPEYLAWVEANQLS